MASTAQIRQQNLIDRTGFCVDSLMEYRQSIYQANGHRTSPLVARLDRVVAEVRQLRVELSAVGLPGNDPLTGKAVA